MKKNLQKAAALKYRHRKDNAPQVVAKGKGKGAEKIIEVARAHGIPIREDEELIEFLSMLDLYEEIPPDLYRAIAEILAFVYALSGNQDLNPRPDPL